MPVFDRNIQSFLSKSSRLSLTFFPSCHLCFIRYSFAGDSSQSRFFSIMGHYLKTHSNNDHVFGIAVTWVLQAVNQKSIPIHPLTDEWIHVHVCFCHPNCTAVWMASPSLYIVPRSYASLLPTFFCLKSPASLSSPNFVGPIDASSISPPKTCWLG